MNGQEELVEYRARVKLRRDSIDFINMARALDRRERTIDVCPYLSICSNTEEAVRYGFHNTSLQMDPSVDCVGGSTVYARCALFKNEDRRFARVFELIEGERTMRAAFTLPVREGHE